MSETVKDKIGTLSAKLALVLWEKGNEFADYVRAERVKYQAKNVSAPSHEMTPSPSQRSTAEIVSGQWRAAKWFSSMYAENDSTAYNPDHKVPYRIYLKHEGPGVVEVKLEIGNDSCATVQWNNFVKTMIRLDPQFATGPEREIASLRFQLGKSQGENYELIAETQNLRSMLNESNDEGDQWYKGLSLASETITKLEKQLEDTRTEVRVLRDGDDSIGEAVGDTRKLPLGRELRRTNLLAGVLRERDELREKVEELQAQLKTHSARKK